MVGSKRLCTSVLQVQKLLFSTIIFTGVCVDHSAACVFVPLSHDRLRDGLVNLPSISSQTHPKIAHVEPKQEAVLCVVLGIVLMANNSRIRAV